jgi:heme-degrading monooxygenase HmoA
MIAVIFEADPKQGRAAEYFDIATALRPLVERIDGFISIERFESVSHPGKFLSLSFWRDEAAIAEWRKADAHRGAQQRGRAELFARYRLRIAQVVRDYGPNDREQAPND